MAGCGTLELKSHWRDREIIIDGKNTEWNGYLTALEDDKQTSVGLLNDDTYLYVGVVTSNPTLQRQIMRGGITLWFDREGGQDKKFGIHYPLGLGRITPQSPDRGTGDAQGQEPRAVNSEDFSGDVEITGPVAGEVHRMTMAQTGGIEARFHTDDGVMVYELKVPLMDNGPHLFAIGTKPGAPIGMGLETMTARSFERPAEESQGYGGGRRGGFGGRGGRGGPGGPRMRSGQMPEPLKVWAKVQLAVSGLSPLASDSTDARHEPVYPR